MCVLLGLVAAIVQSTDVALLARRALSNSVSSDCKHRRHHNQAQHERAPRLTARRLQVRSSINPLVNRFALYVYVHALYPALDTLSTRVNVYINAWAWTWTRRPPTLGSLTSHSHPRTPRSSILATFRR